MSGIANVLKQNLLFFFSSYHHTFEDFKIFVWLKDFLFESIFKE